MNGNANRMDQRGVAGPDARLALLASNQHGVFTTAHARSCGLSSRQIQHRLATGRWVERYSSVYSMAGAPLPWESRLLAACWAGGFRGVASHRAAAALYGLAGGRRGIVEVTCPRWRRARHDGLVVHETKALGEWDVAIVRGIPVTSVERTLLDLGAVCGPGTVRIALDAAEHRELTSLRRVEAALARLAGSGRPGVTCSGGRSMPHWFGEVCRRARWRRCSSMRSGGTACRSRCSSTRSATLGAGSWRA